jgi:DNA-binding NarL/FixJ family response regulator
MLPSPGPSPKTDVPANSRGQSNRSIAAELVLSPRTVEGHIANLLIKTGCRNRSQLLLWELARR